jgi:hypothetical protein
MDLGEAEELLIANLQNWILEIFCSFDLIHL